VRWELVKNVDRREQLPFPGNTAQRRMLAWLDQQGISYRHEFDSWA
jgi:hypothetical protein